jgi:hypothetical protein
MLVESLPVRPGNPAWPAFAAGLLGRTEQCPPVVALMELAAGRPTGEAAELEAHLAGCAYCRAWYRGFVRPLGAAAMTGSLQVLHEKTVAAPAEPAGEPVMAAAPAPPAAPRARPGLEASRSLADTFMRATDAEAVAQLRPFLADLLGDVGLAPEPERAEAFWQFLQRRLDGGGRLPPEGLPGCLEAFAREELRLRALPCRLTAEGWERVFERCALRYLASNPSKEGKPLSPAQADGARRFYHLVLENPEPTWLWGEQKLQRLAEQAGVHLSDARRLLLHEGRKYSKTLCRRFCARQAG